MADIDTNYDDYDTRGLWGNTLSPDQIHLDQREDAETIGKVKAMSLPEFPHFVEATLHGRVTDAQDQAHDWVLEQLETFDPELTALTPPDTNDAEANYMFQIRALIAQILVQLNRISEKDRNQIDKLKAEYKKLTSETASLQRQLGTNNLMFSSILFVSVVCQFIPSPVDRQVVETLVKDISPKVGEMFASGIQADTTRSMNLANLLLQEYQAKTSKGQADSTNKQEIIQMLDRALNGLTQAARAG